MMKTEGIYTYQCDKCGTLFAVVSRLSVEEDRSPSLTCPKCLTSSDLIGEGHVSYRIYEGERIENLERIKDTGYPIILNANHISEMLGVSKQVVYEMMQHPEFPLIKINRFKRVNRDAFFKWMENQ